MIYLKQIIALIKIWHLFPKVELILAFQKHKNNIDILKSRRTHTTEIWNGNFKVGLD